jgi:hypothetical protein
MVLQIFGKRLVSKTSISRQRADAGPLLLVLRRRMSTISSAEAGRRAEALVNSLQHQQSSSPKIGTHAAHAGIQHIPNAPLAPPLHVATTYVRPADGNYLETDSIYARNDNPTRLLLEKSIYTLETIGLLDDGSSSSEQLTTEPPPITTWAFSSGMMAVSALLLAHSTPLTILIPQDLYHGVPTLMADVFSRHNVTVKRVDMTVPANVSKEILALLAKKKSSTDHQEVEDIIVWMESPSNPKCEVIDIAAVTEEVKSLSKSTTHSRVTTVVDGTMASPIVTRPLEVRTNTESSSCSFRRIDLRSHPFCVVWRRHFDAFGDKIFSWSLGRSHWPVDRIPPHPTGPRIGTQAQDSTDRGGRSGVAVGLLVDLARSSDLASPSRTAIKNRQESHRVLGYA